MLSGLSWLDRLLPVWIVLAMVVGVLLGSFVPQVIFEGSSSVCEACSAFATLARLQCSAESSKTCRQIQFFCCTAQHPHSVLRRPLTHTLYVHVLQIPAQNAQKHRVSLPAGACAAVSAARG